VIVLPLYVTSGEPAGIGPDICLSLAKRVDERPVVILGDRDLLEQRAQKPQSLQTHNKNLFDFNISDIHQFMD
jgi:4-hydroxy-L-threonine phosphate dehydrogenase PdxA